MGFESIMGWNKTKLTSSECQLQSNQPNRSFCFVNWYWCCYPNCQIPFTSCKFIGMESILGELQSDPGMKGRKKKKSIPKLMFSVDLIHQQWRIKQSIPVLDAKKLYESDIEDAPLTEQILSGLRGQKRTKDGPDLPWINCNSLNMTQMFAFSMSISIKSTMLTMLFDLWNPQWFESKMPKPIWHHERLHVWLH